MSSSYTQTESESFTIVHARYIASKMATDLLRLQRFYEKPSNEDIDLYEEELVALLKNDYIDTVTYGFKRNDKWVVAVRYRALPGGSLVTDDDPGKIRPGIDLTGTRFYSFLTYNANWNRLAWEEKEKFKKTLPFQRSGSPEPGIENGYWAEDKTYSAGGRGVGRSTLKQW